LRYIEEISGKTIKEFNFRDKRFGWDSHYETITFTDGTEKSTEYFKNLFYRHNILRPSCHKCNYANANRPGDITIADFWGIDKVAPEFYDKKGVSLVIINNLKGKGIFDNIKDELEIVDCSIENCLKYTYTLNQPTPKSEEREKFWKDYFTKGFNYIIEKYAK
jgi:coenzyme F420-reducing hydrogenase beta subunit